MMKQRSIRRALLAALMGASFVAGCDVDNHKTATGLPKTEGLTPNEGGEKGSGSTLPYKINAGGPGAPGTTAANPEK